MCLTDYTTYLLVFWVRDYTLHITQECEFLAPRQTYSSDSICGRKSANHVTIGDTNPRMVKSAARNSKLHVTWVKMKKYTLCSRKNSMFILTFTTSILINLKDINV